MNKLDEIVTTYHCEACRLHDGSVEPTIHRIKSLMLAVIGEDEPVYWSGLDDGDYDDAALFRNNFREELRQKVEEL